MRLFVALDLDESIRTRIAGFVARVREFAPDVRWVRPEFLHVTVKFIGEKREEEADIIRKKVATIHAHAFDIKFGGFGFFPSSRSPRVFWIGIEAGPQLPALAASVDQALTWLNIAKKEHAFNAHLTLARAGGGSGSPRKQGDDRPNLRFARLQENLSARPAPDFGTMTARKFYLYLSRLSQGGSKYTKIAEFDLH